ncbi:MAG: DUF6893 family small protein [Micromonosporaceae bacterium]
MTMMRQLLMVAVLVGIGVAIAKSWPDLERYMKIRRM